MTEEIMSEQLAVEQLSHLEPSEQSFRVADALLNDRSVYQNAATMRHGWACIIDRALAVETTVKQPQSKPL